MEGRVSVRKDLIYWVLDDNEGQEDPSTSITSVDGKRGEVGVATEEGKVNCGGRPTEGGRLGVSGPSDWRVTCLPF